MARFVGSNIPDVTRACGLAVEDELTGAYDVGTQETHSFKQMVELINDALEPMSTPSTLSARLTSTSAAR